MLRTATATSLPRRYGFGVRLPAGCRWRAHFGTYASEDYMSDYFGIDADNAARSGLDQYDADAGFKDTGVDLVLGFGQGPGWRASLIGRYRRLLDDAADSPIVKDEGDRDQYFAGAVVGYRF